MRNGTPRRTSPFATDVAAVNPLSARSLILAGTGLAPLTSTWLSRTACSAARNPCQTLEMLEQEGIALLRHRRTAADQPVGKPDEAELRGAP